MSCGKLLRLKFFRLERGDGCGALRIPSIEKGNTLPLLAPLSLWSEFFPLSSVPELDELFCISMWTSLASSGKKNAWYIYFTTSVFVACLLTVMLSCVTQTLPEIHAACCKKTTKRNAAHVYSPGTSATFHTGVPRPLPGLKYEFISFAQKTLNT